MIRREDVLRWHRRLAGVPEDHDVQESHRRLDAATERFTGVTGAIALQERIHLEVVPDDPTRFDAHLLRTKVGDVTVFSLLITPCTMVRTPNGSPHRNRRTVLAANLAGTVHLRKHPGREVVAPGRMGFIHLDGPLAIDHISLSDSVGLLLPASLIEGATDISTGVIPDTPLTRSSTSFVSTLLYAHMTARSVIGDSDADVEGVLIDLTRSVVAQLRGDGRESSDRVQFVRDAVSDLIERRHRQHDLTVSTIASELHMSRRQLYRYFDDRGIAAMIAVRRAKTARRLLQQHPHMPIEEVAVQAGFVDANRLRVHFKRQFGMRPTDFRAMLTGAVEESGPPQF